MLEGVRGKSYQFLKYARKYLRKGRYSPEMDRTEYD